MDAAGTGFLGAASRLVAAYGRRELRTLGEDESAFEKIETTECGKLIEHEQDTVPAILGLQFLGQPAADLVEH